MLPKQLKYLTFPNVWRLELTLAHEIL